MSEAVSRFIDRLQAFSSRQVFNPWSEHDADADASRRAPQIRADQLSRYLAERVAHADLLLIAEAAGYQGAKFSGCAMTSERMLLGHLHAKGINPQDILSGPIVRTSRSSLRPLGFNEPTATVVWSTLLGAGLAPRSWVNWNAFAFHPHREGDRLSNRTPGNAELHAASDCLRAFLEIFPRCTVVAVGAQCARTLDSFGVAYSAVRHPSMGGATRFRAGMHGIISRGP